MEGIIISIVIAIVGLFLQSRSEKNKKAARERAARENNTMKPSQIVEGAARIYYYDGYHHIIIGS